MKSWPKTIGIYASLLSMLLLVGFIYWWTIRHGTPTAGAEIRIRNNVNTSRIEPPEPFSLGLSIRNSGYEFVRALKIESTHPEIVKNDMGLLIGIPIDHRTVNGQPATESLLADFGDIGPNSTGTARWIMSCSLSGCFTDFDAEFTRAYKLGGLLTSLIAAEKITTCFLVGDVMVDAEGRGSIEDFPAKDDEVYRIHKSDFTQTEIIDQFTDSTIDATEAGLQNKAPPTAGFMYVRLDEPFNGTMLIESAIRSDGKRIKAANVWFSKTCTGP